ncbi:hypothetical protein Tco_1171171, partial [Tanacetum coccineum]
MDKCKTGLGYNVVPPPYTRNFMSSKSDLVYPSLDDFVDESASESVVEKPTVGAPPIIEEWVFDSDEEDVPKVKTVEMFIKSSFAKINFVKPTEQGNPQQDLKDKGVIDSDCSRHMTGNRSYLTDYEEIDGGFVAFRGNSKGGKLLGKKNSVIFTDITCVVLSPDFKLTNESHVLLKVPRKDNMYNVDLKNVVPQGGLTCLFAKAIS